MPQAVNGPDPKGSGSNSGGIVIGNRPSKAASISGARKAAAQAKADRKRITVLVVIIVAALGAIGWHLARNQKPPESVAAQRQTTGVTPDSMARRPRNSAAGAIGRTPGMPAPSLPGGAAQHAAPPPGGGEPEGGAQSEAGEGIH